jgi:hypothetical protein
MKLSVAGCSLLVMCAFWSYPLSTWADPNTGGKTAPDLPKQKVSAPTAALVDNIVFIDKKDCCPCTDERTKSSWKALQTALKDRKNIRVTRIHYDTQKSLTNRYTALRPLLVIPGIYLLSNQGSIVEFLQGEVRSEQIEAALKKSAPAAGQSGAEKNQ